MTFKQAVKEMTREKATKDQQTSFSKQCVQIQSSIVKHISPTNHV